MRLIAPCKGCDRRHAACWGECAEYRAWKKALEEAREAKHSADQMQAEIDGVRRRVKRWAGKRKHGKRSTSIRG